MSEEINRTQMTVAVYYDEKRILLALKKERFGMGLYNGFGGRVEADETIEGCARRETFEEGGILVGGLEKMGIVDFEFEDKPESILEVHFFRILTSFGSPRETQEMRPEWFRLGSIPYDKMFPADRIIFPYLLSGQKFRGRVLYNGNHTSLLEGEIERVDFL